MKLHDWIKNERGRGMAIAQKLGVAQPVVSAWVSGKKGVPLERCAAIELATGGEVSRKDLRPADWHLHWPELVRGAV